MQNLNEIGIKKNLAENLGELIKNDRLPHAILLQGGSSELRAQLSAFLSRAFVCESNAKPCGVCRHCIKATENNHPDVITLDPAAIGEKIFKISLVRELKDDAYIIPNEAQKKVYILKSADKMNIQAQNALLKLIEEPPMYARFILECESSSPMLETIMSRVTSFDLGAEAYDISDELKQKADDLAQKLAAALLNPTELGFMRFSSEFEKDKNLFEPVLPLLQLIFRDALAVKVGSKAVLSEHSELCGKIASRLTLKSIMRIIEEIDSFKESILRNANKNLLITRFTSQIRSAAYER